MKLSDRARFRASRFLSDETGGEKDNINTMLLLALIILPLVFLILYFGRETKKKSQDAFQQVIENGVDMSTPSGG